MGDYTKKPKEYKRGRCLEFERICREEREAGETVVVAERCSAQFPCLANIMVLAGVEQPCKCCTPHVQKMRDLEGWKATSTTHGTFYTSEHITAGQQQWVRHRIAQCDIRNWLNSDEE